MVNSLMYRIVRILTHLLIRLFSAEAFNRLCWVLPGRLVVQMLRELGASIGEGSRIRPPVLFDNWDWDDGREAPFSKLSIGSNCSLGRGMFLDLREGITIEDDVTLAMGVMLITHTGAGHSPLGIMHLPSTAAPIVIRKGAYVGARAIILQGVEIGEMSIVAAGAVVVSDVLASSVYGGVPAKIIRRLDRG